MGVLTTTAPAQPPMYPDFSLQPLIFGATQPLLEAFDELSDASPSPKSDAGGSDKCQLCFGTPHVVAVGSCSHIFCQECLLEACESGLYCCPSRDCREPIRQVRLLGTAVEDPRYTVCLKMPAGSHAGITLTGRLRGPGCAVTALVTRDEAFKSGLRVGDVVLAIDGEPIKEPSHAIELINALSSVKPRPGTAYNVASLTVLKRAAVGYEPPPIARKQSSSHSLAPLELNA